MPDSSPGSLLARFQEFQASARAIESTGDPALDLLLSTSTVAFATLVRKLCVPHWFTAESVAIAGGEARDFEDLLTLPFVRLHPLGFTYHDEIRRVLRVSLLRDDPAGYVEICRLFHDAADRWMPREANDETASERLCLRIAADPSGGFAEIEARIRAAREAQRINLVDTLVHILEEQLPILPPELQAKVDYYRALLLYDGHAWNDALEILGNLRFDAFEPAFAESARFRYGLTLEHCGSWKEAERYYKDLLKTVNDPQFRAKVLHRLAHVALALRDLGRAAKYSRQSLDHDRKTGGLYGEALNLRLLGVIHEKLRDRPRAEGRLNRSLEIFRKLEMPAETARCLVDLGNLMITFGEFEKAREYLNEAASALGLLGDSYGLAFVYANLGKVAVGLQQPIDEALAHYNASLQLFQQFRDRQNAAKVLRNLSVALKHQGRADAAAEHLERAIAQLPPGDPLAAAWSKLR